jgi:hypothetical protein
MAAPANDKIDNDVTLENVPAGGRMPTLRRLSWKRSGPASVCLLQGLRRTRALNQGVTT